jgi:hypothetical protein
VAVPKLKKILAQLPAPVPQPPARPEAARGRIPILLVSARPELGDQVSRATDPVFDVMVARSGPEAVVRAVATPPWVAFVAPDLVPWNAAKTTRSLRALKRGGQFLVSSLPSFEGGERAIMDAIRRTLSPPFTVTRGDGKVSVTLAGTFAPSCIGAVRASVETIQDGVDRVALEFSPQDASPQFILAVGELKRQLEHGVVRTA